MSRQPIQLRRGLDQSRKKRKKEKKSTYTKGVGISKLQSNGIPSELCSGSGVAVILFRPKKTREAWKLRALRYALLPSSSCMLLELMEMLFSFD